VVAALVVLGLARPTYAYSGGIASTVFNTAGCPMCHGGGALPSVVLGGPTAVAPGSTADYTLTVFGGGTQNFGGFNVAAPLGALSTGGAFALGTQAVTGLLGLVEITHSAPKQADFLNAVEFSFRWTAPAAFTSVTLRGWGNAVNHNGSPSGDGAVLATLEVHSSAADTPTPANTATPTPTVAPCGDAAPLQPALLTDPAARVCQAALAKAAVLYVKKDLKAVQSCLKAFQKGDATGDPIGLCAGTAASVLPADGKTAAAIAKAQAKARAVLAARCPDAALAPLGACADTASALATCVLVGHRQRVLDAVAAEYGVVVPTADRDVQKCQAAIGDAARGYVATALVAGQKCLAARNAAGSAGDGAALCVGSVNGNTFIPPLDAKAAAAVAAAGAKLAKAIHGKCDDAALSALDACGANQAGALACLLCTHRTTVFALVSDEFGGTP
jgi:hypothetical protein